MLSLPLHNIQAGRRKQRFCLSSVAHPQEQLHATVFDICLSRRNTSQQSSEAHKTQHNLLGFSGKNTLSNKGQNAFCSMFPVLFSGQKKYQIIGIWKREMAQKEQWSYTACERWPPKGSSPAVCFLWSYKHWSKEPFLSDLTQVIGGT